MKKTIPRDVEERSETLGMRVMRDEKKRWEKARLVASNKAGRVVTFSEIFRERMNKWADQMLGKETAK